VSGGRLDDNRGVLVWILNDFGEDTTVSPLAVVFRDSCAVVLLVCTASLDPCHHRIPSIMPLKYTQRV
jgi:hypothetical protein